MSAATLERWMKKNGKNAVDVASAIKVAPITITRYLRGENQIRPIAMAALEVLIKEQPEKDGAA